jgi:hypothetical protein
MTIAVNGRPGHAGNNILGLEVTMTAAASTSKKEPVSAAPSSAALLSSTPSHSSASLRDSASVPGIERTISDEMVIPLKHPGLGPHTPSPAG